MTKIETFNTLTITTGDQARRQGGHSWELPPNYLCSPNFVHRKYYFKNIS